MSTQTKWTLVERPSHSPVHMEAYLEDDHGNLIAKVPVSTSATEKLLLSLAPEMAEALRRLEDVFAATDRAQAGLRDFAVCDLQDALKKARAILAKLEGGTR